MPPLNLHETTALAGPPPTFLDDAGGGRRALDRSTMLVTLMAALASFGTYACMYAFRKPFAAGTFAGAVTLGFLPALPLKTLYLIAQVIGYATSKMLGVKLIAEAGPAVRARAILGCIAVAELSLVLFAVLPAPYNALAMVLNGLPLGLVWGLVVGFIEGRRTTDVLGSILAASFIVASGMAKSVGLALLGQGVPEVWMPAAAGALFLAPLAAFVALLARLPPPTAEDERLRTRRAPMNRAARRAFVRAHLPGLAALTVAYVALTAFRDLRDNYARELWDALGYAGSPAILTTAELPIALGALAAVAVLGFVRNSRRALAVIHGLLVLGVAIIGLSTFAFRSGLLAPATWMITVGLGLYVAYLPFNAVLFDRLIAALGSVATAGFLIYFADAFGYAGSVALLLVRAFVSAKLPWVEFLTGASYATAALGVVLFTVSGVYFARRTRAEVPR